MHNHFDQANKTAADTFALQIQLNMQEAYRCTKDTDATL